MCFVFTVPALAQQKIKDTTELGAAGKAKEDVGNLATPVNRIKAAKGFKVEFTD